MFFKILLLSLLFTIVSSCGEPNEPKDFSAGNDIFELTDFIPTAGFALDVEVLNGKVFVANSEAGIQVLDFTTFEDSVFISDSFKRGVSRHKKIKILEEESLLFVMPNLARLYAFKNFGDSTFYLDELGSTNSKIPRDLAVVKKGEKYFTYYVTQPKEESPFSLYFVVSSSRDFPLSFWERQGFYLSKGEPNGIFADTSFVYIADGEFGLTVTTSEAEEVLNFDLVGEAQSVFVADSVAFVSCGSAGVYWLDLRIYLREFIENNSVSTKPALLSYFTSSGFASEVALWNEYLLIADGGNGLVVLNLEDKKNPVFVQKFDTKDANAIAVYKNKILLADDDGVYIFKEKLKLAEWSIKKLILKFGNLP